MLGTGVREWCVDAGGSRRFGWLRGGTSVMTTLRDRSEPWNNEWKRKSGADVPHANVGFRCIKRLGRPRR